ncbi:MAG: hypothetical protein QGH85_00395 [Candidatus Pacebacteria bacterium]|jgi:ABC-type Fe3+-siderophore transport system permease subunit|nr:hypothetical protein [Parcubacteria group bacterium]MDP6249224.1 hypothetical protein [Candidatus Paceibacterota bacterium]MDP7159031.1 hypothetical protein [Candidatus Paceibacterota bacterium]MDP7366634.1 hypothetical protein [Candidatus Paceibacterota bacterium]MDP7466082.1 hypothetical protein [Candidatus Paceibacterota bacterium]|tara:strand:- start:240 stop:602 length:363 start_codon:yes stop_codon:yes gene_type:complete
MNIPKTLYWFVFLCIFLGALYLTITGNQSIGFTIFFVLGMLHAIVFYIAEKDFLGIRSKVREIIFWISGGIHAVWEDKLIIPFAFIAIISVFFIILLFLFWGLKKLFCEPRAVFKALQRL